MTLLEALLLFLSVAWLLTDAEDYRAARVLDAVHGEVDVRHREAVEQVQRAEQRLQQLTDQAVLAMVAELRRQRGNDW